MKALFFYYQLLTTNTNFFLAYQAIKSITIRDLMAYPTPFVLETPRLLNGHNTTSLNAKTLASLGQAWRSIFMYYRLMIEIR